jgi:hypothetical protein
MVMKLVLNFSIAALSGLTLAKALLRLSFIEISDTITTSCNIYLLTHSRGSGEAVGFIERRSSPPSYAAWSQKKPGQGLFVLPP